VGPTATCELQGYVYDARLCAAELYEASGRHDRAAALRAQAAQLYRSFNEHFWNDDEGTYALALDGNKQAVWSVASNPGHCLWSGIVPPDRGRRVAARLMQKDMWTGWGIRTLSKDHPAYNPHGYQVGAVWPHDNALIALGLRRYGCDGLALRVVEGIVAASDHFELNQLPELFAGVDRTPGAFPVWHVGANVPQGWAAGALFSVLQVLLGFQPDAPNGVLYLDPILPDWMPKLVVHDLALGKDRFDLRVYRDGAETQFEVTCGPAEKIRRRAMNAGR
jgi:glycogen debranching enzyme